MRDNVVVVFALIRRGDRLACMKRAHHLLHALTRSPATGAPRIHEETIRPAGRIIACMPFLVEIVAVFRVNDVLALTLNHLMQSRGGAQREPTSVPDLWVPPPASPRRDFRRIADFAISRTPRIIPKSAAARRERNNASPPPAAASTLGAGRRTESARPRRVRAVSRLCDSSAILNPWEVGEIDSLAGQFERDSIGLKRTGRCG